MSDHLFDNRSDERKVLTWLRNHLAPDAHLRVASAYFSIYAFEALKHQLQKLGKVQFLFGDPDFLKSLDPGRPGAAFSLVDGGLKLSEQIQQNGLARECAEWIEEKVDIRSVRDGRLAHGKMYHLAPLEANDKHALMQMREAALMGSSNFTKRGIGGTASPNIELNMVIDDDRDRKGLRDWFDDVWKDDEFTKDDKAKVLSHLHQLARDNEPEWVYYVTLWHLFKERIARRLEEGDAPDLTGWRDSQTYNALYSFQKHGAQGAIHKLLNYNGCILADSVGLGKTFEALAAIKYFELRREKVLVLCPKKLRENWELYQASRHSQLNPFPGDNFQFALLSHTDLSRDRGDAHGINLADFRWEDFGLIVIDESHNFRNNAPGKRDENGDIIRQSRYGRLIQDVIGKGVKTRVLLLSATPVNTDLRDLRNQLHLVSAGKVNQYDPETLDAAYHETLGIPSLNNLTTLAQREFNAWATPHGSVHGSGSDFEAKRNPRELLAKLPSAFFRLLDELSIARSREHIRRFYQDDLALIGSFPDRLQPIPFSPDIDLKGLFPTYDQLHEDIAKYQLSIFKPSQYVKEEFKSVYEKEKILNFSQESREGFLIGMMRVNFLKRLESSVHSFEQSIQRTIQKIDDLEKLIGDYQTDVKENPEYSAGGLWGAGEEDEETQDAFEVTQVGYSLSHLDVEAWLKDLKKDKVQLNRLYLSAKDVTPERDAKLHCLKEFIAQRAANAPLDKTGKPNRKVLLFTAFADTAKYLFENLHAWAKDELDMESALVTGGGDNGATFGGSDFGTILTNFSPVAKNRARLPNFPQTGELDLLIATDCISEGQNLQDCGCVVNYDIHWNPVRLIQRFGRVDRLGSLHHQIQMVNFWPTEDLNRYINLKHRVEARMALVDVAGSNQDNILSGKSSVDEETKAKEIIESDLSFRDHQLLRLRDETPDIDELDGGVSLSEFTLDDFIADLMMFLEKRRAELERAPLGLFAVVPPATSTHTPPGIVWCLRRRDKAVAPATPRKTERGAVNRFAPYYLLYVKNDGTVFLKFDEEKKMLSTLRALCRGRDEVWDEGCRLFDADTHCGEEMGEIVKLLESATKEMADSEKTKIAGNATGGFTVPKATEQATSSLDGWDLITWFVIQTPDADTSQATAVF